MRDHADLQAHQRAIEIIIETFLAQWGSTRNREALVQGLRDTYQAEKERYENRDRFGSRAAG